MKAAEGGGTACQLDLAVVLPGETEEDGRFRMLEQALEAKPGIREVHVRRDGTQAEVCVHYYAAQVPLPQVLALLRASGAKVTDRYRHKTWFMRGMDCGQCGPVIERALRRQEGVLSASVLGSASSILSSAASKPAPTPTRSRG